MQHDLFWPTIAQAVGSGILVLATGALVWATFALVTATKVLAKVGEDTWKSQVQPVVWLLLKAGVLSDSTSATVRVRNACAVKVTDVSVNFVICSYQRHTDRAPFLAKSRDEISRTLKIGDIDSNSQSNDHSIWDSVREALEYAVTTQGEDAEDTVGGMSVFLNYRHSITGETFTISTRYLIEDMHRGSVKVTEIERNEARRV